MTRFDLNRFPLWTAVVTPFDEEGAVDYGSLKSLLETQQKAGCGVVLLGSTGEGLALEDSEKKEILRFASQLSLKVPVMSGVSGFNLKDTLKWLEFCESVGVDAYLMPTPLYAKPGFQGQLHWFKSLLDHVSKPCMLYNIPSRAGVKMSTQMVKELAGHPRFWAMKEASGSIADFQEYRENAPQVKMYSGDDGLMPAFAAYGAKGLVSVASNVWPEATRKFVELSLEGKTESLFPIWKQATDSLFVASNPVPVKILLKQIGWIKTACVRPPLSLNDLQNSALLARAHEKIKQWESSKQ